MEEEILASWILTIIFFVLLFVAAAKDIKHHKVPNRILGAVCFLGVAEVCRRPTDRWETVVLTCLFFCLLLCLYFAVAHIGRRAGRALCLGGADVKLAAGAMLFLGWQEALSGMFAGLFAAAAWYVARKAAAPNGAAGREEFPLVPWLVGGMVTVALLGMAGI